MAAINADLGVINLALSHLGIDPILSIDDPGKPAQLARLSYDTIRDLMLRAFTWNFAIDRRAMVSALPAPAYEWAFAYNLSDEILRVLDVYNSRDEDWKVEGRRIVTNQSSPIFVKSILRAIVIEDWDPMFVMALSYRCSLTWAENLSRQASVTETQTRLYIETMREAISTDSLEMREEVFDVSDWIIARSFGSETRLAVLP